MKPKRGQGHQKRGEDRKREESKEKPQKEARLTLIELLQESALYRFPSVRMNKESEKLVVHLPAIHDFLILHSLFGDEDVDDLWVCHRTVTFEPLANDMAEVSWRDVESIEGTDFWSLVNRSGFFGGISGERLLDSRNGTTLGRWRERVDELELDLTRFGWTWLTSRVSWSSFLSLCNVSGQKEQTG